MTFLEHVVVHAAELIFSSTFPAPSRSGDTPRFGPVGSLRTPRPPPIVPPATAGSRTA